MAIHPSNQAYKDFLLSSPYQVCIDRARYVTRSYKETQGKHPALRAALAFGKTVRNMTIVIHEHELLGGNRTSKPLGVVIPVERGDLATILEMDLEMLQNRKRQPFLIDHKDKKKLLGEILPWWQGKTARDLKKQMYAEHGLDFSPTKNPLRMARYYRGLDWGRIRQVSAVPKFDPAYMKRGIAELLHNNPAFVMNVFDVQGHLILGHKNILKHGFSGKREQAKKRLAKAQKENDSQTAAFYEAVILCCDAMADYAARVAAQARKEAEKQENPDRKKELLAMAARCDHVPFHPPRDFAEAVQALWLTQAGATIAHGMAGIFAIGRFDQYLYPYFEKDKKEGKITNEQAVRLMEELLIKLGTNLMILPYAAKKTANELGSDSAAPTVGGVDENGEDATNELSFLILDAFTNVKSMGNSFSIRLSEKSPKEWWEKSLATYRQTSGAALFSDEVTIQALESCGLPVDRARDYGVIGCVEPTSDGDTFGCTSGNDLSLAAAVEMALHNGDLRILAKRLGPKTGDPKKFKTFDQFFNAVKEQIAFLAGTVVRAVNIKDRIYMDNFPCPLVSATLEGCVESGKDMTAGGARFNFSSIGARAFGTSVDSLAAVKYHVFDRKTFSMGKLVKMIDKNFKGYDKERAVLLYKTPKYGSDDDYADDIAVELCDYFCNLVGSFQTVRNGPFRPGFFSYGLHVLDGLYIGAMPSGRVAGEPVSNSFSPANGSEKNGPTAMLRSLSKLNQGLISNGCAVNVKFLPSLFSDPERTDKMIALVKTYFSTGGMELSPNVVSRETLIAAQNDPETFRDLVVRVSGYSAHFTDLGKPLQDEIISRTAFEKI